MKYTVSPSRAQGRNFFSAAFFLHSGKRVMRSLGTDDQSRAKAVALGLERLWKEGIKSALDAGLLGIDDDAVRIFFELSASEAAEGVGQRDAAALADALPFAEALYEGMPVEELKPLFINAATWKRDAETGRAEVARVNRELAAARAEIEKLKGSVVGQAIAAVGRSPDVRGAAVEFSKRMYAETTERNAREVMRVTARFLDWIDREAGAALNATAVTRDHVERFLDEWDARGDDVSRKLARRDAARRRLGRFLNFCAATWEFPSVMLKVRKQGKKALERERHSIQWNEEKDVQAVLKKLDVYWRAIVGTFAYAGLQLSELLWLRRSDVVLGAKSGVIHVTSVTAPDGERHLLKTGNRERSIDVDAGKLLPLLRAWSRELPRDSFWFFPVPAPRNQVTREELYERVWAVPARKLVDEFGISDVALGKRCKRLMVPRPARGYWAQVAAGQKPARAPLPKVPVAALPARWERWDGQNLCKALSGQSRKTRGVYGLVGGKLPAGMNAMSLRRTFGSLLIRKGYSLGRVAALMGNTEDVVRSHYGRIAATEVKVNL